MNTEAYNMVLARIAVTGDTPPENVAACGACGFQWDDTISTSLTPAPSARCPNEYNHEPCPEREDYDGEAAYNEAVARWERTYS